MAAIVSAQTGPWSTPSTWVGGVVPGLGDTTTVAAGHTVTITASIQVGSSPATGGTPAIQCNGPLTLAANVTAELFGDLVAGDVAVTMGAGSTLQLTPAAGVTYAIQISTGFNQFNAKLVANGTQGSPCVLRKTAGAAGTVRGMPRGFEPSNNIQATWLQMIGLGTASLSGWEFSNVGSQIPFFLDDGVVDTSGEIILPVGLQSSSMVRFRRVRWMNGLGSWDLNLPASAAQVGGERILDGCAMPLGIFSAGQDILLTGCRLGWVHNAHAWHANSQDNMILATASDLAFSDAAVTRRWYLGVDVANNGHWIAPNPNLNQTYDQIVMESPNTWGNGDGLSLSSPGAPRLYRITRSYILPNASGFCPGRLVSGLGNDNVSFEAEHCTAIANALGGVGVGETYAGRAGMGKSRSNLFWTPAGQTGYQLIREPGSAVQDICQPVDVDYNGLWGISAGTDGQGVNVGDGPNFFSVAGQHQLNGVTLTAGPFIDAARKMATFDALQGGPGTYASGRANFFALTPGYDVATFLDWIVEGYQVTTSTLQNAGHDGVTIGASPFSAGGAPQTLTPAAVVATALQSVASVLASILLPASVVVSSMVVPAPTVHASVVLMPAAMTATATVPVPSTMSGAVTVGPASIVSASLVPGVSLAGSTVLSPPSPLSTAIVPTATVQVGGSLQPAPIASAAVVATPTMVSATAIAAPAMASLAVMPAALMVPAGVILAPAPLVATALVPTAALGQGSLASTAVRLSCRADARYILVARSGARYLITRVP